MSEQSRGPSIWRNESFRAYLGSTGFSGMALAMQQLLLSWILIGILKLPADQVGLIQAVIGLPGVFLMLAGGASADRVDARRMLIRIYLLAPLFPLFLVLMEQWQWLGVVSVLFWGLGMTVVQSFSMPGQQALLNRIAGSQIQQGVTAATAIGFVVQVVGLVLAGQIDEVGVTPVLLSQAVGLALAGAMMIRVPAARPEPTKDNVADQPGALAGIRQGLNATFDHPVIFHVLTITFASSIFNAGAFITVFPFIVVRIYDGSAWLLAVLMAIFYAGATLSNMLLLRYQPLLRPGKLFLIMQLSRILVVFLMWIEPPFWLFVLATVGWGLNMGITTNLARSIVQESAPKPYLGRILSVFSIGMVGSAPLGAVVLGWLIEAVGTLNALIPAMLLSGILFVYGALFSPVWGYRSNQPRQDHAGA
jgi:MFS family permease